MPKALEQEVQQVIDRVGEIIIEMLNSCLPTHLADLETRTEIAVSGCLNVILSVMDYYYANSSLSLEQAMNTYRAISLQIDEAMRKALKLPSNIQEK